MHIRFHSLLAIFPKTHILYILEVALWHLYLYLYFSVMKTQTMLAERRNKGKKKRNVAPKQNDALERELIKRAKLQLKSRSKVASGHRLNPAHHVSATAISQQLEAKKHNHH